MLCRLIANLVPKKYSTLSAYLDKRVNGQGLVKEHIKKPSRELFAQEMIGLSSWRDEMIIWKATWLNIRDIGMFSFKGGLLLLIGWGIETYSPSKTIIQY